MGEGRGSALVFVGITLLVMVVCGRTVEGAVYTVGDAGGWTFGVADWATGKNFVAGDVLVFNYNKDLHNVVLVSADGYQSCATTSGSREWSSGNDRITLDQGTSYFICGIPGHCAANMKIAVTAS